VGIGRRREGGVSRVLLVTCTGTAAGAVYAETAAAVPPLRAPRRVARCTLHGARCVVHVAWCTLRGAITGTCSAAGDGVRRDCAALPVLPARLRHRLHRARLRAVPRAIAIAARPLSLRQCSHAACCEHAPIASCDAVQSIAAGRMLPVACCTHAVRCAQVLTQDDGFTLGRLIAFRGYFGQVCNRPPYFGVREY
jgi:hypothetical protein